MQLIVHYPKDKQELFTLSQMVSTIHGEYIHSYLDRMEYSKEQKIKVVEDILRKVAV